MRRFQLPSNCNIKADAKHIAGLFISNQFNPGMPEYQRYHALSEWVPEEGNLYNFLQWGVQGSPGPGHDFCRITCAGFFSQGMYYPELRDLEQLNKGNIEFKRCQETLPNGQKCQTDFEGDKCPQCQNAFNDTQSQRIEKSILYVPRVYHYIERQKCKVCDDDNYFPVNLWICPQCQSRNISQITEREKANCCKDCKNYFPSELKICPECGSGEFSEIKERKKCRCGDCGHEFPINQRTCPLCGSHDISQRTTSLLNYIGGIP
ncbi:hypothetical protein THIOM_002440 [Candidatus Thiomargarita nelsonii]|uniref:DZANK-type domain-containing protein n=1 Tax=Candidatus Thiomargarita nelsonii TaxID=1003181 RepID=A0A0A6P0S4_9GAMM|nr:hypothetical protein THIOM_002440 [Candidatus Thiomargarita nelsonii]